ncbi:polysaccharide deacetylase family protein [Alicyclobacillus curvatus]|nr:polysaccharide deacetylase family protein [Alicyclobacillus curvatus]
MSEAGPKITATATTRLRSRLKSVRTTTALSVIISSLLLVGCDTAMTNTANPAKQNDAVKPSTVGTSSNHGHVSNSVTTKSSTTTSSVIQTSTTQTSATGARLATSGALWFASPLNYEPVKAVSVDAHVSVPVLMYHDITYLKNNSLGMSATQFDSEMTWLYQHGFHPINLGQLFGAFYHGYKLPSRPIVITFDDGYKSVYSNAFPELQKYHFQATVFMITGAVGRTTGFPELSWSDLQAMESSGLVDVESHTVHHIALSLASAAVQQAELVDSANTLQTHLRHPILYFCYPSSNYNQQTMQDLKTNGYLLAFTEHPGYANSTQGPYQLHRLRVWEDMPLQDFAGMLSTSLSG